MDGLKGKVVVVTGAGRGMGRAFSLGFAREGAKVVLVGRRRGPESDPETLAHTARLIAEQGGESLCCAGSVDDIAAMQQMSFEAIARFGGIDILVNNAGMHYMESFSNTTLGQWNEVIGGFLTGPFVCSKVVVPSMIQRGGGKIINLGSYAAISEDPNAFAYGVVRGGMVRMTLKMANDLKTHGIAVNSYGPGLMLTERVVEVLGSTHPRLEQAHDPAESVPHVLWMAQQPADRFTGQVVYMDEWEKSWGPSVSDSNEAGAERGR